MTRKNVQTGYFVTMFFIILEKPEIPLNRSTDLRVKGSLDVNSPSTMTSSPQFPLGPLTNNFNFILHY